MPKNEGNLGWRSPVQLMHDLAGLAISPSAMHASDRHQTALQANDIREVCPYVTEQEALKALEMCSNR